MNLQKQIASPYLTGGGGNHFEEHIQSAFTLLMLVGGYPPQFPNYKIRRLDLQAKPKEYETDDLIIHLERIADGESRKILAQIKHGISITSSDTDFREVINAAWKDFNNESIFNQVKDVIALITGPINRTDSEVRVLLNMARKKLTHEEFFNEIEIANYCSNTQRKKLEIFRTHLKTANGNIDVPDDEAFNFLRSFHLFGYDLDFSPSVTLSLLQSMICQYQPKDAHSLWTDIVDYVKEKNQAGGSITLDDIPDGIKGKFVRHELITIPEGLLQKSTGYGPLPNSGPDVLSDLGIATLIGCWSENFEEDRRIIEGLTGKSYSEWIVSIRKVYRSTDNLLSLNNGVWRVVDRGNLWEKVGEELFDDILEKFYNCAVTVLSIEDPALELPLEKRFAAAVYGKSMVYSECLRTGFAETLALMGTRSKVLVNCSHNKPENTVIGVLRNVFSESTWALWASINSLLPLLAESNPSEFLKIVDGTIISNPEIVTTLYEEGGTGLIWGRNYIVGLIWALENLAWKEEYLVYVCVVLGFLTQFHNDNSGNSPLESLKEILIPWHPQTLASIQQRKVAVETLNNEYPEAAWDLVLKLLPSSHQVASGTHTPKWYLDVSDMDGKTVPYVEYHAQIDNYSNIAVDMAIADTHKLIRLIQRLNNLSEDSFYRIIDFLDTETISGFSEKNKLELWKALEEFLFRQKTYSQDQWVEKHIEILEDILEQIKPNNLLSLHNPLFCNERAYRYEEVDTTDKRAVFAGKQIKAVQEIIATSGFDLLLEFVDTVDLPRAVGNALGSINEENFDDLVFQGESASINLNQQRFISGYIWAKNQRVGISWINELDVSSWALEEKAFFLNSLPFTSDTWGVVDSWLGDEQGFYWEKVEGNPYEEEEKLDIAIEKLVKYNRPLHALECVHAAFRKGRTVNIELSKDVLLKVLVSTENSSSMTRYHIIDVIKFLQNSEEVTDGDMFQIEWAYLPLLDRTEKVSPKTLEKKLASDPTFFCEVLGLIYKSNDGNVVDDQYDESTRMRLAENAYHLLHVWMHVPGIQSNGEVDINYLERWVKEVVERCTESGRLDVALIHIGHVLIYSPKDVNGLWINQGIAELLNKSEYKEMRNGFRTALFNSMGVHWIDPEAKPEKELAEKYRQQADDIENMGCFRLAETMRDLAVEFDQEAERIIKEHLQADD